MSTMMSEVVREWEAVREEGRRANAQQMILGVCLVLNCRVMTLHGPFEKLQTRGMICKKRV